MKTVPEILNISKYFTPGVKTGIIFDNKYAIRKIMKFLLLAFLFFCSQSVFSQEVPSAADSTPIVVHKDPRIDQLIKKQIEINEITTREARRNVKGFRLLVINTNNREEALAAKTKVYTYYPELKPYLIWQSPNFKLKVGNFKERKDAEEYRQKLNIYFPKGVYVINDIIEVKLDRPEQADN